MKKFGGGAKDEEWTTEFWQSSNPGVKDEI